MKIDEKLMVLEEKIDKLTESNSRQDVHLERLAAISEMNTDILEQHMRRTEANELRIEQTDKRMAHVETELVKHLSFVKGAFWLLGGIFGIFGFIKILIDIGILRLI